MTSMPVPSPQIALRRIRALTLELFDERLYLPEGNIPLRECIPLFVYRDPIL